MLRESLVDNAVQKALWTAFTAGKKTPSVKAALVIKCYSPAII